VIILKMYRSNPFFTYLLVKKEFLSHIREKALFGKEKIFKYPALC
jgi:hypothetical protein